MGAEWTRWERPAGSPAIWPYPPLPDPWSLSPVLGSDVRHNVLIEEFQDQRDAVGKHQVLCHILKLQATGRNISMPVGPHPPSSRDKRPWLEDCVLEHSCRAQGGLKAKASVLWG